MILVIDELEARLHPLLTREIVRMFNGPGSNPRNAQPAVRHTRCQACWGNACCGVTRSGSRKRTASAQRAVLSGRNERTQGGCLPEKLSERALRRHSAAGRIARLPSSRNWPVARKPKPSGRKRPEQGAPMQKRAIRTRELRPRFLIVCEGEKTEPNYFQSFRVNADVKVVGTGRSPKAIVEHAQTLRRQQDYSQSLGGLRPRFVPRRRVQRRHRTGAPPRHRRGLFQPGLRVVVFASLRLPRYRAFPPAISGDSDQPSTRFSYRKNDRDMYQRLQTDQAQAIRSAQKLLEQYQPHRPADDDPCTTVHLLVQELNRWLI